MVNRVARTAALVVILLGVPVIGACQHVRSGAGGCEADGCPATECPPGAECDGHAKVCHNPTLMALAHDLDHLEKHIDWYGSAVPKVPDVWGQARLTQYREEFEREMAKDLSRFEVRLSGAVSRADSSLFTFSQALEAAATAPKRPLIGGGGGGGTKAPAPAQMSVLDVQRINDAASAQLTTPNMSLAAAGSLLDNGEKLTITQTVPAAVSGGGGGSGGGAGSSGAADPTPTIPSATPALPSLGTTAVVSKVGQDSTLKTKGVGLEPTLELAQKKRYLDLLNQLRRENEGDDKADAPGYALNLIRIPVSVFPGKRTENGFGAEVTFTIDPVLGDELLPATFRNLVVNDLLNQLGYPLTQFLNDRDKVRDNLNPTGKKVVEGLSLFNRLIGLYQRYQADPNVATLLGRYLADLLPDDQERVVAVAGQVSPEMRAAVEALVKAGNEADTAAVAGGEPGVTIVRQLVAAPMASTPEQVARPVIPIAPTVNLTTAMTQLKVAASNVGGAASGSNSAARVGAAVLDKLKVFENAIGFKLAVPALSHSPGLINKTGFPTSQLLDVYGLTDCFEISFAANAALSESIARQKYAHLPDVQAFLQQEIIAAIRMLREPEAAVLWERFCTQELVSAVRTRKVERLQQLRREFRQEIERITQTSDPERLDRIFNEQGKFMVTSALAWCVLVDSALLTDRLIQDMKETAAAKGRALPQCDAWLPYYLPDPPAEARAAFNAYVKLRWPVYVFALDPATEDQNISDALNTRRETQLALSVAFVAGRIGTRTMTQFARRLDAQYEALALNRTHVGFGHGENVFGWRFYPRFQTPETRSNLNALVRDQLIGGPNRDQLLRERRLEPGMRECVALVVMPSFVPYVTVDSVSNWFALANPKHKVLDHTQAARLSRTVKTLQNCRGAITDAECYRDGELARMQKRVEQLENRLPTQTLTTQVPVLNTLGGFEMFSNGTTDLAPELYGFYGAPGVASDTDTTLFLVGDHFSPLRTRVIVGNTEIAFGDPDTAPNRKMLSRQVVQVTVPAGKAVPLVTKDGKFVQAHVATPYGVTQELLIPYIEPPAPPAGPKPGFTVGDNKLVIRYGVKGNGAGLYDPHFQGSNPSALEFTWVEPVGGPVAEHIQLELVVPYRNSTLKVPCACAVRATATGQGKVVVEPTAIRAAACDLIRQIRAAGPLAVSPDPLAAGLTAQVWLTQVPPPGSGLVARKAVANDKLSIELKAEGYCQDGEAGTCPPCEPAKPKDEPAAVTPPLQFTPAAPLPPAAPVPPAPIFIGPSR